MHELFFCSVLKQTISVDVKRGEPHVTYRYGHRVEDRADPVGFDCEHCCRCGAMKDGAPDPLKCAHPYYNAVKHQARVS